MSSPTTNLDVNQVLAEVAAIYGALAATGHDPLVAELAQLRVLTRMQTAQLAAQGGTATGGT